MTSQIICQDFNFGLLHQGYAAKTVFEALQAQACHENMVKVNKTEIKHWFWYLIWYQLGRWLHPWWIWQFNCWGPAQQPGCPAATPAQQIPPLQVRFFIMYFYKYQPLFLAQWRGLFYCQPMSSLSTCSLRSSTMWRRSSWPTPTWDPPTLSCSREQASIWRSQRSPPLMFLPQSLRRCHLSLRRCATTSSFARWK